MDSRDPGCLGDKASRDGLFVLKGTRKKKLSSHLFQTSALSADKSHTVAVVDVGGDGSHAVPSLGVESMAGHQLRATEGLIDVQTAERVIDGHRLQHRGGGGADEAERKKSLRLQGDMSDMLEAATDLWFCYSDSEFTRIRILTIFTSCKERNQHLFVF